MIRRVAVRGLMLHENKLFAVRLNNYKDSISEVTNYWCLPGGGIDDGESLEDALRREMIEETGIAPAIGRLLYVQQFTYDANTEQMEFFFNITNASDYVHIDLSRASHGQLEIAEAAFINPTIEHVKPAFLATEPLAAHIAEQRPVKIFSFL